MNYYNLYREYKRKYLTLKAAQFGGNFQEQVELVNSSFGDQWVLTGSRAIDLYLRYFGIRANYDFAPSDSDILVANQERDIVFDRMGDYVRVQDSPGRSVTFRNRHRHSIDVTGVRNASYYMIDNNRLQDPESMLYEYETNLSARGDRPDDLQKIKALREISRLIADEGLPRHRLVEAKSVLTEEERGMPATALDFSDED